MSTGRQIAGLAGWLALAFAAAACGAAASVRAREFYGALTLPAWAPPGWVFGPVWTVLYAMMAVAAWLVWRGGGRQGRAGHDHQTGDAIAGFMEGKALGLFLIQLGANALWSWLFFAWRLGAWASLEIVVLWALVAATTVAFWRRSRWAGALMIPYLLWVSFATALCYAIWRLNPEVLG